MKKILSLLTSLFMIFALFTPVNAEEVNYVSNLEQLQEAFKTGGSYVLSDNLQIGYNSPYFSNLTIDEGTDVNLDLNRKTLIIEIATNYNGYVDKVTKTTFLAAIVNKGDLTISNGTVNLHNIDTSNGIVNEGKLIISSNVNLVNNTSGLSGRSSHLITNLGGQVTYSGNAKTAATSGIVTYGGSVTMDGGSITALGTGCAGIDVFNRANDNESDGANVLIAGGTLSTEEYAISTNNQTSGGENGSNVTILGGDLTSRLSTIYWPSSGTLTIGSKNGADIPTLTSKNGSAIEVCSGTLNILSGIFNGGTLLTDEDSFQTGDSIPPYTSILAYYRDQFGTLNIGDAVTVIARRGDGYATAPLSVNISGGTFTSVSNYGVRMLDCNLGNESQVQQNISLAITDGNFSGGLGAVDAQYLNESEQKVISGGSFSSDVKDYMTEESKVVQTDTGYQIVPVTTGVALDKASVTLNEKETTTLTATLAPEGAVETLKWTTDNDKVATVDENGKVTAVAPGKATITVKAGTFEAACTVTVNAVSEVTVETPAIDTTNKDEVQAGLTAGDQTAAQEVIKDTVEQIKDVAGNEQTVVNAVSTAVTEGKDITTELVINKVEEKEVASEDVTAVETALSYLQDKVGATSGTVAQYLDLNVLVKVDGTTVGELNQLSKEITVSIAIPTELQTEGRQFYVIRVHGDEITRLPLTKNADGTYSFKTDRFSTYALVYVDGATESYLTGNESIAIKPVTTPPTSGNTETTKPNTETPETSAAMFGGMFATMAVLSAGIAVVLWKKRELSK